MKVHTLWPAALGLGLLLGACRHMTPIETVPLRATIEFPPGPQASIRRPIVSAVLYSIEFLPVPEAPGPLTEGLSGALRVPLRPPAEDLLGLSQLPLPVPLAAPPRVLPSYAMNDRALREPTVKPIQPASREAESTPGVKLSQGPAAAAAPPGGSASSRTATPEPKGSVAAAAPPGGSASSKSASPEPRAGVPAPRAAASATVKPAQTAIPAAAAAADNPPASESREKRVPQREVLARRGDPVELSFEGEGWLFASGGRSGGGGARGGSDGVEFVGSSSQNGRSRFSFKARDLGEYLLSFQLQDHRSGASKNELVRLRVLADEAFARELDDAIAAGGDAAAEPRAVTAGLQVARADRLFEMGEFQLALGEYLRENTAVDPHVNERIAASYAATGEYPAAVKYYTRNLSAPPDYLDRAVVGLVRCALAMEDEKLVVETIPALLAVQSLTVPQELLGLARFQQKRNRGSMALRLLQEYERRYPGASGLDEVLYRMAQLYESDVELRDLDAARKLYRRVFADWPESRFSEPALQRLQYVERHFFDVR